MTDLDRRVPMPPYFGAFQPHPEPQHAARDDDDDDDEDDDDGDDEDDDEDDDELDGLSLDELKERQRETQKKLEKANREAGRRRHRAKRERAAAEKAEAAKAKKPKGDADEKDDDAEERIAAARKEERARADGIVKRRGVRDSLKAAGVSDEKLARAIRLVDLDDLEVDDDGEIDGLDDAIDGVRDDFPELFARSRRRRQSPAGKPDRNGEEETARGRDDKRSATQKQADELLGRNRRR